MSLIHTDCDTSFVLGFLPTALKGSSLEPAAGSTSPSASTRPREAFCLKFEATGCSLDFKDALGYVLESKWHFEVALDMFSCILGELGAPFGSPGANLGSIWAPLGATWGNLGSIFVTFDHLGSSPGPFRQLWSKSYEKGTKIDRKWGQK
jgi:hypothetical protein